ncbi:hypothetical protein A2797_01980 [candidate division WWE3 bacterium RIFCSPHIGHO2_01_FULL_48_15]|uniref:AAA+ ATPase domain-containing protein n=1 Tax=candidate division WWE3 bacterium RIFCSPHIGHO2_01_FULL_48_15 TaxID=1802619 RepID=A0A1F4VFR0_UNCKA|nr:MAG: hypothetical protein A2797_01980 [candidate division WWE3 bacterium RIFCSPHIGHO2_01_FULL_48_15]
MIQPANRLAGLPPEEIIDRGRELTALIDPQVMMVVHGEEMLDLLQRMKRALLCNGHVLLRGDPGEGKTLLCECFAATITGVFTKIQFTPDMLPSDLKGKVVFNPKTAEWEVKHGPIYGSNIVLIDEINRGPAKLQAGLLEVMQERRVTLEGRVFFLSNEAFLVVATKNPIESEGVHELPEAQRGRFLMQLAHKGSSMDTVLEILGDTDQWRFSRERIEKIRQVINVAEIATLRQAIFTSIYVSPLLDKYIAQLREATKRYMVEVGKKEVEQLGGWRWPGQKPQPAVSTLEEKNVVEHGVSPRGAQALQMLAIVNAFFAGRSFVLPEDVRDNIVDCWNHQIFLNEQLARRFDVSGAKVVRRIIGEVNAEETANLYMPEEKQRG